MGREAFALYRQGYEVTGLDISEYAVEQANKESFDRNCEVKFYHYDGEYIPFKDGIFDVVIIRNQTFGLLYGDAYKENYLKECKRILKLEGLLSYSGHSLQYIREHHNDCLEGNKFYPYAERYIYWEAFLLEDLVNYSRQACFEVLLSGEGEIYEPSDGVILHCLCKKIKLQEEIYADDLLVQEAAVKYLSKNAKAFEKLSK